MKVEIMIYQQFGVINITRHIDVKCCVKVLHDKISHFAFRAAVAHHVLFFFFSSRRRHTRWTGDWSSDVCSSDLADAGLRLSDQRLALVLPGWDRTKSLDIGRQLIKAMERIHREPAANARPGKLRSEERRVGKEGRTRWWGYG